MTPQKSAPLEHIVLCGSGLALQQTAAALSRQLPPSIRLTVVDTGQAEADTLYGGVTSPSSYAFNLSAGVSEPQLITKGNTSFSWGTKYAGWRNDSRSWLQCFHLTLPLFHGVLFHHYLLRLGIHDLTPFLAPAVAARRNAFAHPVEGRATILSRAEYGYHFDAASYAAAFETSAENARIQRIKANVADVISGEDGVSKIRLSNGQEVEGDLFVDCSGPSATLISRLSDDFEVTRKVRAAASKFPTDRVGAPFRTLTAAPYGWQANTPLQDSLSRLTLYAPESEAQAIAAHGKDPEFSTEFAIGSRTAPWVKNCVAVGQAAAAFEPISPAPVMTLQRDIERLISLVPFTRDMAVERREYNRQGVQDVTHAEIFNRALIQTETPGAFWDQARHAPIHPKLAEKLRQFESHALLIAYDLEPFNPEDWTILHFGMGRKPSRYDRFADHMPEAELRSVLDKMQRDIDAAVKALPAQDAYMASLKQYLSKRKI